MNPEDPLSQLRDIHLPQIGGFWPPAPGWWVLALLFLATVATLLWWASRYRRRNRWLRLAKAELAHLESTATKKPQWFAQLNTLLKRVARERYPAEHPEAESGEQWETYLLRHLPEASETQKTIAAALATSAWQREPAAEPSQALDFAQIWLEAQKC